MMPLPSPLAVRALEIARSELGNGETEGNNRGEDIDRYREKGRVGGVGGAGSWCAAFVSYCYCRAAKELEIELPWKPSAGAKLLARRIAAAAPRSIVVPEPGCIVCWHRGTLPIDWRGHIGICERYDIRSDSLWTIEGNKGPQVTQYGYPASLWRRRLCRLAVV